MKRKEPKRKLLKNSLSVFFLFLSLLLLISIGWFRQNFSNITLEQLIFHLKVPLDGSNLGFIGTYLFYLKDYAFILLILIFLLIFYQSKYFRHSYCLKCHLKLFRIEKKKIFKVKDDRKQLHFLSIICLLLSFGYVGKVLDVKGYIDNTIHSSSLFEDYYVDAKDVNITFPEEKRNLIYIFLESMESNYQNLNLSGINQNNLIPNLETLARDNIHFSNTEGIGGALSINNTTWTIAGDGFTNCRTAIKSFDRWKCIKRIFYLFTRSLYFRRYFRKRRISSIFNAWF